MDHETHTHFLGNILLVENSRTVREVLRELLIENGYKVSSSANPIEALALINSSKIDLIIMDVYMPQMNGYEAVKKIRSLDDPIRAQLPVIALTSSQSLKDKELCLHAGMNDYIIKSPDFLDLLQSIKKFLPN